MRKKIFLFVLLFVFVLFGCAKKQSVMSETDSYSATGVTSERKVIKSGYFSVSVDDLEQADKKITAIVKDSGGYIDRQQAYDKTRDYFLQIPSDKLEIVIDQLSALGDEKRRTISKTDVTDEMTDMDAILKNKKALRDRLREILKQAKDVGDIMKVENELARIQGEIDSMEARLKSMNKQVAMSALSVDVSQKGMLGPLGWVFAGLWWVLEKLFVLY